MADPHNNYLERAENYEQLAEEAQDPVLASAFRRLARNCRLTAERDASGLFLPDKIIQAIRSKCLA